MSEQDNFENLSNAEIRAKCIQYGLPNIPVTESSRKVLIKKLRVSIGGSGGGGVGASGVASNLPAAVATASPKKQNRRETINAASKQISDIKSSDGNATNNVDAKDNQQRKGRRPSESIAKESLMPTANAPTSNEIRSLKVSLAKSSTTPTKVEEKKPPSQTRRKSVQPEEIGSQRSNVSRIPQRREPIQEDEETTKPTLPQKPIEERRKSVEKHLPLAQRVNVAIPSMPLIKENVLLSNSLVILESDEEEDAQLARAAKRVEDHVQNGKANTPQMQQQAQAQSQVQKPEKPQILKQQQPQILKQQQPQIQKQEQQQQPQIQKQEQQQLPKQKKPVVIGATSGASALHRSEFYQNAFYGRSGATKESNIAAQQMPITSIGTGLAMETETPIASIGTKSTLYGSGLSQVPSTSSGISSSSNLYATISDRYTMGSYNSPMQQRFTTLAASGISMASSPYADDHQKRPPTLATATEFSDDPDAQDTDQPSSPYLSKFARNLERLKSTPITERSSFRSQTSRNRRTVAAFGSGYEPEVRRPLRTEDNEVSGALMKFLRSVDRKYQLQSKMIIFFAIVFIIIIYVLFF